MFFRLIKTVELDPSKNYIFGSHPHGLLASGSSPIYRNSVLKAQFMIFFHFHKFIETILAKDV